MTKLLKCDRWFNGPHFLWKEEDEWPKLESTKPESLSAEDSEVRDTRSRSVNVMAGVVKCEEPQDPVTRIIHYYSRLKTFYVIQFFPLFLALGDCLFGCFCHRLSNPLPYLFRCGL